jgi:purine-binding chemotaxis protein CheW
MRNDLLVFSLGQQRFALPVDQVSTVVPRASLTPLPGAPRDLIGMLRLRGALFPVIDIRARLGLPAAAPHIGDCIVLMQTTGRSVGLIVEGVEGLVSGAGDQPDVRAAAQHGGLIREVWEASSHVVATLDADVVVGMEVGTYLASVANGPQHLQEQKAA